MKNAKENKNFILKNKNIKVINEDNSNEDEEGILENKIIIINPKKINQKKRKKKFKMKNLMNHKKRDKYSTNNLINNIQASIKKKKNIFKFILICLFLIFIMIIMAILAILSINIYSQKNNKEKLFPFIRPQEFLNIYISTHKDFVNNLTSPIYKILCDEKSELKQEYNLTIIETNKNNILYPKRVGYSEGSKIYYIWKLYKEGNLNSKYVGFIHYRRIFPFKNNIPDLDEIFKNYDAIIKSRFVYEVTVREHFNEHHIGHFLNESLEIIREKFPEYYQYALNFLEKKYANFCNIFIMKKEDFIKWGEFVFGVLIEFDRRYNLTTDKDIRKLIIKEASNKPLDINFQRRLQAYLSERISNFFYERHFKKIYEITTLDLF